MKSPVFIGAAALLLGVAGFAPWTGAAEPAAPATHPAIPQPTGLGSQSTSVSVFNGDKTIDVHQPGRTIHIEVNGNGVLMKVTGQIDGKQIALEFKATTPEQLKKDNPNAYALFEQYNRGINPGGFDGSGRLPEDARKLFEKNLAEKLKEMNLPAAQQEELQKLLKDFQNGAAGALPPGAAPGDAGQLLGKDLLEKLKESNLPDAQQDEIKKLLKDFQNGAAGAAPGNAGNLNEKDLLEKLKDSNLPAAQQEEIKKLLKDCQNGAAGAVPPGAAPGNAGKFNEKDLLDKLKDSNLPAAQQDEVKKLLKELQTGGQCPNHGRAGNGTADS